MRIDKVIRIKGKVNKKRYEEDPNSMVSQDQLLNKEENKNKEKNLHILNRQMLTVYYSEILIESKSIYLARRKKKDPRGKKQVARNNEQRNQ